MLFCNTWGKFGVLTQVSLTKSSQGTAGANFTGYFADSRDGTSLFAAQPARVVSSGRQLDDDLFTNCPLANLGPYTAAQAKSAHLPRLMRSSFNEFERERQGFNSSLQSKDTPESIALARRAAQRRAAEERRRRAAS